MRIGLACEGPPPAEVLELLEAAGLPAASLAGAVPPALLSVADMTWLLGDGADLLRACDRGALDLAVVGKDRLLEDPRGVSELLDLRVCRDALVYATPEVERPRRPRPRVATRHPVAAREHFEASGRQVELVEMEAPALAPALGLADGVVELASRLSPAPPGPGPALVVRETVAECSARLVAGRAARALEGERLRELLERLRTVLGER